MWYIYQNRVSHQQWRWNEILSFMSTWIKPKVTVLSEINQLYKDKCFMISQFSHMREISKKLKKKPWWADSGRANEGVNKERLIGRNQGSCKRRLVWCCRTGGWSSCVCFKREEQRPLQALTTRNEKGGETVYSDLNVAPATRVLKVSRTLVLSSRPPGQVVYWFTTPLLKPRNCLSQRKGGGREEMKAKGKCFLNLEEVANNQNLNPPSSDSNDLSTLTLPRQEY